VEQEQEQGIRASDLFTFTKRTLSDEARELLAKIDEGGVPLAVTENLERIARSNGIEVSRETTPGEIVRRLRKLAWLKEPCQKPPLNVRASFFGEAFDYRYVAAYVISHIDPIGHGIDGDTFAAFRTHRDGVYRMIGRAVDVETALKLVT
jgi:hypothetical protein